MSHCDTGANERPAQAKGGNLLLNPVTVVGVLGLWSFIAGGTVRGAGHGHTSTPTPNTCHTRTGFRERI